MEKIYDDTTRSLMPPQSAEQLRTLLVEIKKGKSEIKLGAKATRALGQILELGADQSVLKITTLAKRLGINPSTLTRLSHALGYSAFSELRSALLSESLSPQPSSFYTTQAQQALHGGDFHLRDRVQQLAAENIKNIQYFSNTLDQVEFEQALKLIATAPRVRIYAIRQFLSMAVFLSYGLGMIRADVSLLDAPGLGTAEGLAGICENDVLIAFSCSPYSRQVVEVCKAAHANGISTVVITDRASSPMVEFATNAILVPHQTSFLSNSVTAFAFCVECLINGVANILGREAEIALNRRDMLIEALNIEML